MVMANQDTTASAKSRAQRIRALNEINEVCSAYFHLIRPTNIAQDVPDILRSASSAISALTNRPLITPKGALKDTTGDTQAPEAAIEAHKQAFLAQSRAYYIGLYKLQERLKAEVEHLVTAGLIPSEISKEEERRQKQWEQEHGVAYNGGLGALDVGWLNSRAGGRGVEVGWERELVGEIKGKLETVAKATESHASQLGAGTNGVEG